MLFSTGCSFQSRDEALKEMCNIPPELMDSPTEIGPYLATRISNKEVMTMLETLDSRDKLEKILIVNNINPTDCDLIKAVSD